MTNREPDARIGIDGLSAIADRLDDWAEAAELMDDVDAAKRLREHAQVTRLRAMHLLDD